MTKKNLCKMGQKHQCPFLTFEIPLLFIVADINSFGWNSTVETRRFKLRAHSNFLFCKKTILKRHIRRKWLLVRLTLTLSWRIYTQIIFIWCTMVDSYFSCFYINRETDYKTKFLRWPPAFDLSHTVWLIQHVWLTRRL